MSIPPRGTAQPRMRAQRQVRPVDPLLRQEAIIAGIITKAAHETVGAERLVTPAREEGPFLPLDAWGRRAAGAHIAQGPMDGPRNRPWRRVV